MKKARPMQIILLIALMTTTVFSVNASISESVAFMDFHVTFHINQNADGSESHQFSCTAMVVDLADTIADQVIPGVYDGGLLVDLVFVDGNGQEYIMPESSIYWQADGPRDLLWFGFTSSSVSSTSDLPIGTYTALLRDKVTQETLLFIDLETPYRDANGNQIPPTPKYPVLSYPMAQSTIYDTTPTFQWEYPAGLYEGTMYYTLNTWGWEDGEYFLWSFSIPGESPRTFSATFPDASEYPDYPPTKIIGAGEFPSELQLGEHWFHLIASEWFSGDSVGGNPHCYFITPYATMNYFFIEEMPIIEANIVIEPEALNLASNGKWITGYIELPQGYSVNDINPSSIRINDAVPIDNSFTPIIGDYDSDGIPDLTVKFDRAAVSGLVSGVLEILVDTGKFSVADLTVSGNILEASFSGTCPIKIIRK